MTGRFLTIWLCTASVALGQRVGDTGTRGIVVPTMQTIAAIGRTVRFERRPIDAVASRDGATVYVLDDVGVTVIDARSGTILQSLISPSGTSMRGIVVDPNGKSLYVSGATGRIERARFEGRRLVWAGHIDLPGPTVGGPAYPVGMRAVGRKLFVCLSRSNALGIVDLDSLKTVRQIPVDPAPFDVSPSIDGRTAFVTCWSRPRLGKEDVARSAGTAVPVDRRGIGTGGTVCVVDMTSGTVTRRTQVGSQPTQVVRSRSGYAYVANSNSDTVSVLDSRTGQNLRTLRVGSGRLLGYQPNALALGHDERTLYVACGGVNAVEVFRCDGRSEHPVGFAPTGWYPAGLAIAGGRLVVTNAKGDGSRWPHPERRGRSVFDYAGTVTMPTLAEVERSARRRPRLAAETVRMRPARRRIAPTPVPERVGEPSVFQHVVYVLKENRTYDEVLGDVSGANGDPDLAIFGRTVTPNHHALAQQFALLDNYYCCGVNSADGHAWGMEGQATTYFEKSFGGWTRSYPFGDDPLATSSSGYMWDPVLDRGLSFRNFGEFDYASVPGKSWSQLYADYLAGRAAPRFGQDIGVARLRSVSSRNYPGWNLGIPDVIRARTFISELRAMERNGSLPRLTIVYLQADHTSGTTPGQPTPRAMIADNDLALGQVVEAISRSRSWKSTCVFVNEDDAQNGFDHVDGHRSLCLVVSPYTHRRTVVSRFYNQDSVLHTMHQILGVPPMNMKEALSPLMTACFGNRPNFEPFRCEPASIRLNEMNPAKAKLSGEALHWATVSETLPFGGPDRADDDILNHILWFATRPNRPYPPSRRESDR